MGSGQKSQSLWMGQEFSESGFWAKSQSWCMGQEFSEEWVFDKKSIFMYGARIFRRVGSGQNVILDVWGKNVQMIGFWAKSQS